MTSRQTLRLRYDCAALKKNFPDWEQGDTVIACFGTNTLAAIEENGWRADIKAPTPEFPSITTAIKKFLEAQHD